MNTDTNYTDLIARLRAEHGGDLDDAIAAQQREIERLTAERDALQAQVDRLMLEHCPDEMTAKQVSKWASKQEKP